MLYGLPIVAVVGIEFATTRSAIGAVPVRLECFLYSANGGKTLGVRLTAAEGRCM